MEIPSKPRPRKQTPRSFPGESRLDPVRKSGTLKTSVGFQRGRGSYREGDQHHLVGGWPTPLKNDGVRQWEGWQPIYETSHVPNHQLDFWDGWNLPYVGFTQKTYVGVLLKQVANWCWWLLMVKYCGFIKKTGNWQKHKNQHNIRSFNRRYGAIKRGRFIDHAYIVSPLATPQKKLALTFKLLQVILGTSLPKLWTFWPETWHNINESTYEIIKAGFTVSEHGPKTARQQTGEQLAR